jgi:hypothetical protein
LENEAESLCVRARVRVRPGAAVWYQVRIEKARGVLFGPWGFDDDMRERQGTTALFWGAAGVGRSCVISDDSWTPAALPCDGS